VPVNRATGNSGRGTMPGIVELNSTIPLKMNEPGDVVRFRIESARRGDVPMKRDIPAEHIFIRESLCELHRARALRVAAKKRRAIGD